MDGYKKTKIGMIPEGWEIKKIGDICDVKGGKRLPKGSVLQDEKNAFPYIRVADMNMGNVSLDDIKYVPLEVVEKIKRYTISKDDLYISVAGTLGLIGKIPPELDNANLTENADKLCNITCNKDYLYYALCSEHIQKFINSEKTSNAQPKLALTRIKEFQIALPLLPEQKKIALILSSVDDHIGEVENMVDDLKELKKGLMQKLFTQGIGHTEFKESSIGRIPVDWELKTLGDMCRLITKQTGFDYTSTIKPSLVNVALDDTIPMLQTKDFKGIKMSLDTDYYIPIDVATKFPKILIDEKCLLISIVGASIGNVGLFDKDDLAFLGGAICISKFKNVEAVDFSYYFMESERGQKQIRFYTKGAGQATVTIEDIRKFKIPQPPIEEQKKIAKVLSDVDERIEMFEKEYKDLQELKKGLFQQLLTGKKRVKID